MQGPSDISPVTLNRLSIYLRCLRRLQERQVRKVSSQQLAVQYNLSATQIRKDLTQFGEFGIRGVGYDVDKLVERLSRLLGLDKTHSIIVVGMGNLGSALANHIGFNDGSFAVVAGFDNDPDKVGQQVGRVTVRDIAELPEVVRRKGCEVAVLAVPAEAAQRNYDAVVAAGIRSVLSFAPVRLKLDSRVHTKNVDLRINLEELAYYLTA